MPPKKKVSEEQRKRILEEMAYQEQKTIVLTKYEQKQKLSDDEKIILHQAQQEQKAKEKKRPRTKEDVDETDLLQENVMYRLEYPFGPKHDVIQLRKLTKQEGTLYLKLKCAEKPDNEDEYEDDEDDRPIIPVMAKTPRKTQQI